MTLQTEKALTDILDDVDFWVDFRTRTLKVIRPFFMEAFLAGAEAGTHTLPIRVKAYAEKHPGHSPQSVHAGNARHAQIASELNSKKFSSYSEQQAYKKSSARMADSDLTDTMNGVEMWTGGNWKDFKPSMVSAFEGKEMNEFHGPPAIGLTKTLTSAPANAPKLYRGVNVDPAVTFTKGQSLDLGVSSFSARSASANKFTAGDGKPVKMELDAGSSSLNLQPFANSPVRYAEAEYLSGGRFSVTSVSERAGVTVVGIRQEASLAAP